MFVKGDIILPKKRVYHLDWLFGLYHAAVVWQDYYDGTGDFDGIMLTSSGKNFYLYNIIMDQRHFDTSYKFQFDNTYFVNQLLMKLGSWGPFKLKGKLTREGIRFIEDNLTNKDLIDFPTFRKITSKS